MMAWFEESLVILAYSKRTQLAIWLGVISFVLILAMGDYFVGRLSFQGMLAPLTDVVREALLNRYEKAAWLSLGGFMLLAIKFYRKDRKRLLAL
jgi:membrane associated rhomboid family serine protease